MILVAGMSVIPFSFSETVPDWVKNTAGWWSTDAISEKEFVNAIEFLVNEGIIDVTSSQSTSNSQGVPDWVKNTAGWWSTDAISDTEFVNAIEFLVNSGIIITDKQLTTISDLESFFKKKVIDERGPKKDLITPYINTHGFRNPEISQIPIDDTYRIFAVGGSTTFGIGGPDGTSWPAFLREKFESIDLQRNVEVINAGIPSATSHQNSLLITNKLVNFEPDLLIIYEGVNDQACALPLYDNSDTDWSQGLVEQICGIYAEKAYPGILAERYSEICDFGQKNNFDVIVILQPTVMLDDKILTDQELSAYFIRSAYGVMLHDYDILVDTVIEQTQNCHSVLDMTDVFSSYDIPIYFDFMHPTHTGNEILAQKILEKITPLLVRDDIFTSESVDVTSNTEPFNFYFGDDLENSNLSSQTLDDESFLGKNLFGSDFSNSVIKNTDFRLANLDSTNFANTEFENVQFRQNIFKNSDFSNVDFSNIDVKYLDLSQSKLINTNFSGKDLSKTFFHKSDLIGSDLSYTDMSKVFLNDIKLTNVNFYGSLLHENSFNRVYDNDISGINFKAAGIQYSNFEGLSFYENDLTLTTFLTTNLKNTDFSNLPVIYEVQFANSDLTNANFDNVIFSVSDIYTQTFPGKAHLCGYENCMNPRFDFNDGSTNFFHDNFTRIIGEVKLNGDDVIISYIVQPTFNESNLKNVSFKNTIFKHAVFHNNENLSSVNFNNADLSLAHFINSDLTGVDFTNAKITETTQFVNTNMKCIGHEICDE